MDYGVTVQLTSGDISWVIVVVRMSKQKWQDTGMQ